MKTKLPIAKRDNKITIKIPYMIPIWHYPFQGKKKKEYIQARTDAISDIVGMFGGGVSVFIMKVVCDDPDQDTIDNPFDKNGLYFCHGDLALCIFPQYKDFSSYKETKKLKWQRMI